MLVDITRAIQSPGTEFPFEVSEVLLPQDIVGEEVTFDTVKIKGVFAGVGDSIFVRGELSTTAYAKCSNCLAPAQIAISVPFANTFVQIEQEDDPDKFLFSGSKIDFGDLALSHAVLALPMRFLCTEDCQGFCGRCGALKTHCTCQKDLQDEHPFAALQELLTKDEEV